MGGVILICEDSLEGVFSGIYQAYAGGHNKTEIKLQIGEQGNYELFAEYVTIETDSSKAGKVAATIHREFGADTYLRLCRALATEFEEKGNAVYHAVEAGLKMQNKRNILGNLTNPFIHKVFEMDRYAQNEIHHLQGFLRFQELKEGILFARIGPKNNILTFLTPHFSDRLPLENFMIYDDQRDLLMIHPAGKESFLASGDYLDEEKIVDFSGKELEYQELFKCFCHNIGIKERKNLRLQRQMLPLRFQEYMVEFH